MYPPEAAKAYKYYFEDGLVSKKGHNPPENKYF